MPYTKYFFLSSVLLLCLLLSGKLVQAQGNLLITDVDDTIKQTYVRPNELGVKFSKALKNIPFYGMKELYDSFSEYKDNKIIYLSYSPSFVFHWLGEPFIEDNKFPYKENIIQC